MTITEPKIKIVQVGETVRLKCNVETTEDVTISWSKENGVLPEGRFNSRPDGILIITNVNTDDKGVYICSASNAYFVVTDKAVLEIGSGSEAAPQPQMIDIQPSRDNQVQNGGQIQLTCFVENANSISWIRNGQVIAYGGDMIQCFY